MLPEIISTISIGLLAGASVIAFAIGRAPGWGRVRIVGLLAGTGLLYSLSDVVRALPISPGSAMLWAVRGALFFGALHASAWLWFSFSDADGNWSSTPVWIRVSALANVLLSVLVSFGGLAVVGSAYEMMSVPSIAASVPRAPLSSIGLISAAGSFLILCVSMIEQVRQFRSGVPGALGVVVGFVIFLLTVAEEVLVSLRVIDFIYLAEVGLLFLVVSVTAQLFRRFLSDAERLSEMTQRLTVTVETATHERDEALGALVAEERFAALGRIASGVGHEINNPLQYLTLNLEELREYHVDLGSPAAQSLSESLAATERIRRVVWGLRSYAQPSERPPGRLDPVELMRAALAESGVPANASLTLVERLAPVPAVIGDEAKLRQAFVAALTTAASGAERATSGLPRVEVRTSLSEGGDVIIEVLDNGPGFPEGMPSSEVEPSQSTRLTAGGAALSMFILRGIVEAHGGTLEAVSESDGGALLRIMLPSALRSVGAGT